MSLGLFFFERVGVQNMKRLLRGLIMLPIVLIFIGAVSITAVNLYGVWQQNQLNEKLGQLVGDEESSDLGIMSIASTRIDAVNSLNEQFPNVIGWIYIPGTVIDYPILKGEDNDYYLTHTYDGAKSKYGSIFVDKDWSSQVQNTILYGHNMKDEQMFGQLSKFKEEDFFMTQPILLVLDGEAYIYEPLIVYMTDARDNYLKSNFATSLDYDYYLKEMERQSIYQKDSDITSFPQILTLSTCDYEVDEGRLVIVAGIVEN